MTALDKGNIRDRTIADVLRKHGLKAAELYSRSSAEDIVEARREIATRLKSSGFRVVAIARILKRTPGLIEHYLRPNYPDRKRNYARASCALKKIPRGLSDLVAEIAKAEGISPTTLAAEWIAERATYEAQQKARAA